MLYGNLCSQTEQLIIVKPEENVRVTGGHRVAEEADKNCHVGFAQQNVLKRGCVLTMTKIIFNALNCKAFRGLTRFGASSSFSRSSSALSEATPGHLLGSVVTESGRKKTFKISRHLNFFNCTYDPNFLFRLCK